MRLRLQPLCCYRRLAPRTRFTGDRQLALISEAQELELGRSAAAEVRASLGLVDDRELQAYIERVGTTLERAGDEQRSPLPSWLSTHPAPRERIDQVQEWITALPPQSRGARVAADQYLQRLDGLVFGQNPRQGFFRDGVFYHPDLRFRFHMPAEWQTQNLPDAVIGVSPNRDAALQLTLAGEGDPTRAAQAFFSQGPAQVLNSTRQPINGVPAIVTVFDAATEQGVVRGIVSHLAYGGRTYQLLGYSPQRRFGAYDRLFERVIGSFAPLTNSAILNVRPQRVDIVRLNARMTLAEFSRRYDSEIPIAELAVINQAAGPDATFEAGTLLKRVIS